jgi:hypothetical protein
MTRSANSQAFSSGRTEGGRGRRKKNATHTGLLTCASLERCGKRAPRVRRAAEDAGGAAVRTKRATLHHVRRRERVAKRPRHRRRGARVAAVDARCCAEAAIDCGGAQAARRVVERGRARLARGDCYVCKPLAAARAAPRRGKARGARAHASAERPGARVVGRAALRCGLHGAVVRPLLRRRARRGSGRRFRAVRRDGRALALSQRCARRGALPVRRRLRCAARLSRNRQRRGQARAVGSAPVRRRARQGDQRSS